MWALIRKETLENIRWLPLACLLTCGFTIAGVYQGLTTVGSLTGNTMFVSSVLAIGFALLQSIPDERNGARAYLLHRGISAAQVFWAKSLVGFALLFIAVGLPLVLCALWLAMRGVLNAPGRPIQMLPPATMAFAAFLFHPAVLLVIYRPARWLGSRVVPMAVPILAMLVFSQLTLSGGGAQFELWATVGVTLVVLLLLLLAARRAYVDLARLPAPIAMAHGSVAVVIVMIFSVWLATAAAVGAIAVVVQSARTTDPRFYQVTFNKSDHQLWVVRSQQRWVQEKNRFDWEYLSGAPLKAEGMPDPSGAIPADFSPENNILLYSTAGTNPLDIAYARIVGATNNTRWNIVVDRRGYILCYHHLASPGIRLGQVISRDGIHDPKGDWGQPFDGLFSVDHYNQYLGIVGDKHGIYRIDDETRTVAPLIERPIDSTSLSQNPAQPLRLYVRSGARFAIYDLTDDSGLLSTQEEYKPFALQGKLSASLVDEVELPTRVAQLPAWSINYRGVNDWTVHGSGVGSIIGSVAQRSPNQSEPTVFTVTAPPEVYPIKLRDVQMGALTASPLPVIGESLSKYLTSGRQQHKTFAEVSSVPAQWLPWILAMFLLQGTVAAALTWYASQRRGLSRRASWLWSGLGLALGWSVPLTVLACHPKLVRETCSHCHKPRRVDLADCEHCHAKWERAQREGVEIIEHEFDADEVNKAVRV